MQHFIYKAGKIFSIVILSILISTALSNCSKDSSNPADDGNGGNGGGNYTVTLNGDGWTNKTVTIVSSNAFYSTGSQHTVVNMVGSDNIQLNVYTPSNQTGTFNFADAQGTTPEITITLASGTGQGAKIYFGQSDNGSITISSYGAVGQKVSGSFNGKLTYPVTQAEITVSGTFSATRQVDLP